MMMYGSVVGLVTLGILSNSLQVHLQDLLLALQLEWWHFFNWIRNSWIIDLTCCLLWWNSITSHIWHRWSNWCDEYIRELGAVKLLILSAMDCAIVLDKIRGKDPDDLSSTDIPLGDPFSVDITKLTVGYLDDANMEVVHVLASKGVAMIPFKLKYTVKSIPGIAKFTMGVEMSAHFDEWLRSGQDDHYEAQDQWPKELRHLRAAPAVDYIQAQRARGKLIREIKESFTVDALIGSATDWERICLGNLVVIPVIVIPTGFINISDPPVCSDCRRRTTFTIGIYAPPHCDDIALALAMAYQSVTNYHIQRPPI